MQKNLINIEVIFFDFPVFFMSLRHSLIVGHTGHCCIHFDL